jgi:peptide/nickel transport system substrate-binding protein
MRSKKSELSESKFIKFLQKFWIYIVVVIAVIAVVVSSVEIYKEEVLEIDPDVQMEVQNTITVPATPIDTLNPIISKTTDVYYLSKLLYSSLFRYTNDLNVEGDLVESYTVDTEKAYIDITLKSGVLWSDGSNLQGKDIKFTVDAIKAKGSASAYYKNVSKISSVKVNDELNIRIYFSNNSNCALDNLTFPILPSSKYNNNTSSLIKDTDDFVPVGTGQYKFSSYEDSSSIALVANDKYYGTKAKNNINVSILPNKDCFAGMLEIQSITCYVDDSDQRKSVATDKGFKLYDFLSNNTDFVVFNTAKGVFESKEMRQAASYAINKAEIIQEAYADNAVVSDTIFYPNFLGVEDTNTYYNYSTEKTKELLSEAGYDKDNSTGKLYDSKSKVATVNILVNNDNTDRIMAAKLIANDLKYVGFEVEVTEVAWEEYTKLISKKDFDILITGYEIEASYDLQQFFNGSNPWGYKNKDILAKVKNLEKLYQAEEYKEIYSEIKEMLLDEMPYYPLCYKKIGLVGVETFEAQLLPTFFNIYKNCNTWSWKKVINE